jgi:Domain of unknown function (DUF6766)
MSAGAWMMVLATGLALGGLLFVIWSLVRSIMTERSGERSVWREFGLGLALTVLFFITWIAHAIAEWQTYTDEQLEHGGAVKAGDFFTHFAQSTLENWQSEFLQLFAFVVLAALYIHKGSAESKDGTDKIEASLRRIEEHLGTMPNDAPQKTAESWKLPDTQLQLADADGPTREELYADAQARNIPGRSTMTKEELQTAVDARQPEPS